MNESIQFVMQLSCTNVALCIYVHLRTLILIKPIIII